MMASAPRSTLRRDPISAFALPSAPADAIARVYSTGEQLAVALGIVGLALTVIYAINFYRIHEIGANYSEAAALLVASFGIGTVLRLVSDAPSGLLQARSRIALDN